MNCWRDVHVQCFAFIQLSVPAAFFFLWPLFSPRIVISNCVCVWESEWVVWRLASIYFKLKRCENVKCQFCVSSLHLSTSYNCVLCAVQRKCTFTSNDAISLPLLLPERWHKLNIPLLPLPPRKYKHTHIHLCIRATLTFVTECFFP